MPIEDDLRASLRRAAASADPPGSAWDQLVDRAERPAPTPVTTRSRIGAGLVAAVVTIAAFALVIRAFGPPDPAGLDDPVPLPAAALDNTRWLLDELDGVSMADGPALELTFEGGEYGVRSECNDRGGRYEIEGARLTTAGGYHQTTAGCQGAAEERQAVIFGVVGSSPAIKLTGATLTLTSEVGVLRYVMNPCSLLTDDEVQWATGDPVTSSGVVPPERLHMSGGPRLCSYEVPGRYASVVVHVVPATLQKFHAVRDRNPEFNITIPVEGIGDEAYIEGMASISVFRSDHYVGIGLQHGAGAPGVTRVLEDLARAALGIDPMIDRSLDEPVPTEAIVAEGQAPGGTWTLVADGGDRPTGLELRWRGSEGEAVLARIDANGDLQVVAHEFANQGNPSDAVVFGITPPLASTVGYAPGQGLPEKQAMTTEVLGADWRAFSFPSYAPIGVVSAWDAEADGRHVWRVLIVPPGSEDLLAAAEAFLEARRQGHGAGSFLEEGEASRFVADEPVPLGSASLYDIGGRPITHALVLFVDAATIDGGARPMDAEVGVRLEGPGGVTEETLRVSRREDGVVLISLARTGATGP